MGRYGWNRATLADERARNRQRKARPEAPEGRGGYKRKRRSDRSGARSRIGARYSGTGSEQKAPDRCRTSGDAGRIQTTDRRGKAPCCVAASTSDARVSTWRKCGSSQSERPCAGIEETRTASADAGGSKDPGQRKVHSLIDKVYAPANLAEAWRHVRDNKGGAGIDGLTIDAFADREEERLAALHRKLRDRSYRPSPVKRVGIPKPDGGLRKLGIPSVTDRVVQQALVQKMAPIFEPHFADCSFGYRPGRSPHMAMRKVWQEINEGNFWILDADIRAFFDAIDQDKLVSLIAAEISDGRVLHLIRSFLDAGVIEAGKWQPTTTGVPQGGVATPPTMLRNFALIFR